MRIKPIFIYLGIAFATILIANSFFQQKHSLFLIWDTSNESCDLTIIQFPQQNRLHYRFDSTCDYSIENIDGHDELLRFDYQLGIVERLQIDDTTISVKKRILLPNRFTDIPQLSRDGTKVYFSSIVDNVEQIYVTDVNKDETEMLLTQFQGTVTQPKLSPDKRYLTYLHNPEIQNRYECFPVPSSAYTLIYPECLANSQLYLMDLITNESVNLTTIVALK
ncbi:MAG: hypothetical protein IPL28_21850 [Chloroflexi bacterium]|nr:hypothetical protein [Chloroflexota bacterium]